MNKLVEKEDDLLNVVDHKVISATARTVKTNIANIVFIKNLRYQIYQLRFNHTLKERDCRKYNLFCKI